MNGLGMRLGFHVPDLLPHSSTRNIDQIVQAIVTCMSIPLSLPVMKRKPSYKQEINKQERKRQRRSEEINVRQAGDKNKVVV